ncbi:MAG: hypothetical protein HN932_12940 [Candidatus Marinimicrobia bacterium]|mgnify:CR=1 FL=1|jgi:hypothetical protein|nr:hypothetical protein [Candidatus Neomarinimicrobiota bacterium]MBT7339121.1 hypothetical protein [Candidatus Jacksonbacteria bacterium]
MSDRIRTAISITPVETLASSEDATKTRDILSPVTNKPIASQSEIALGSLDSAQGWASGVPAYQSATTSRVAQEGGGGGSYDFVYIRHTGYKYVSSSVLGVATSATLDIQVYSQGEADYVTIARLQPGDIMPFLGYVETGAIFIKASTSTIAVEYMRVT